MTSEEYKVALAEALRKLVGIMPVGAEWCRAIGKGAPKGGIAYLGQSVTRAMYSDLWDYVQTELADSLIEESEWQTLFTSQNGNVPYYSKGDGSTTFRMPCISGYIKGAKAVSEVGQYTPEGLPNIVGTFISRPGNNGTNFIDSQSSLFKLTTDSGPNWMGAANITTIDGGLPTDTIEFNARMYNSIYGNSTHVTPETVAVLFGVYAVGTVVSIGEATEEGILAELGNINNTIATLDTDYVTVDTDQVITGVKEFTGVVKALRFTANNGINNNVDFLYPSGVEGGWYLSENTATEGQWIEILVRGENTQNATVVATYSSGTNWYRKWSDGWIEQGGRTDTLSDTSTTVTFPTAFTSTNYTLLSLPVYSSFRCHTWAGTLTNSTAILGIWAEDGDGSGNIQWYACGY